MSGRGFVRRRLCPEGVLYEGVMSGYPKYLPRSCMSVQFCCHIYGKLQSFENTSPG